MVTVVKDPPKLNAGSTQSVDPGKKVNFNISVEQEFGGVKSLIGIWMGMEYSKVRPTRLRRSRK